MAGRYIDPLALWRLRTLQGLGASFGEAYGDKLVSDKAGEIVQRVSAPRYGPFRDNYGTGEVDPFAPSNFNDLAWLSRNSPESFNLLNQMQPKKSIVAGDPEGLYEVTTRRGQPSTAEKVVPPLTKTAEVKPPPFHPALATSQGFQQPHYNVVTGKWEYEPTGLFPPVTQKAGADDGKLLEREFKLRGEYLGRPEIKSAPDLARQFATMEVAFEEAEGQRRAGRQPNYVGVDQALGVTFQKMLDPTSVVRESEFMRTAESAPVVNRLMGWVNRGFEGGSGLTDDDRAALLQMARRMEAEAARIYGDKEAEYRRLATQYQINPENVVGVNPFTQNATRFGAGRQGAPAKENLWNKPVGDMTDEELDALIDEAQK